LDQRHLFERFFRAENASTIQGTGLGLHIVKKYVELLSGTIRVKSELGKGTRIEIRIPVW
jgi:signal transduction histidine kinase